jgi:hypothetical protein
MHATLCDYVADIVQNAVEAAAGKVVLEIRTGGETIGVTIRDNGKGMSPATLAAARDPFWTEPGKHDARKVGLGLPFLQQVVDVTGGSLDVRTTVGQGTTVAFALPAGHWDTPPLGDLPATVVGLMVFEGDFELILKREHAGRRYEVSRGELAEALGGLAEAGNVALARQFLRSQEAELLGGSQGG